MKTFQFKTILNNYKSSIILLTSLFIGGALGITLGDKIKFLTPIGESFINLIFMLLVPMVFFSISSAIANMEQSKNLKRILFTTFIIFGITAIISATIGLVGFLLFNPTKNLDFSSINQLMNSSDIVSIEQTSLFEKLFASLTVNDFIHLLTKNNMLAVIIFSMLIGFGTNCAKEKGEPFAKFLLSGNAVTMSTLSLIMKFAPVGLGCYFATTIGSLGSQIASGFASAFLLYSVLAIIYYFIFFTLYAFIAGNKKGVISFWKNASEPSVTALATCSSAACIPSNISSAIKMGVPSDIANIVMPIGVNMHKDGSVIGAIFKIMFVMGILGIDMYDPKMIVLILFTGILVGAIVGAVPGGGAIGEMLILSIFGFPPATLAIMLVIATIIDAPATLLNSAGNTVCTMLISKFNGGLKDTSL